MYYKTVMLYYNMLLNAGPGVEFGNPQIQQRYT